MKRYLTIDVSRFEVDAEALEALIAIYPEGYVRPVFNARLLDTDPRVEALRQALESRGVRTAKPFTVPGKGMYRIWPSYEYEPEDLARASHFTVSPPEVLRCEVERRGEADERVQIVIDADINPDVLHRSFAALHLVDSYLAVSTHAKGVMEEAGLVGAVFRETQRMLEMARGEPWVPSPWWQAPFPPLWALTSSIVLPPLSPECNVVTDKGEPPPPGQWSGLFVTEGRFPGGELHYRRSDLDPLGAFDVALTRESFGATGRGNLLARELVVSRRFKDLCEQHGFEAEWDPVYVDEGE